ncbi:hypothetical protein AQUCO_00200595v1 [Aquilegia coerulea]|uniref:Uncharacterized protein n=1 Tax=Aquilegia coerulea TaxID=218851 RepID=A0A2G5F3X4_AQUCA|nr:hypothetical protein AQUCO_00200595v1 [Aquilegia coerulea]
MAPLTSLFPKMLGNKKMKLVVEIKMLIHLLDLLVHEFELEVDVEEDDDEGYGIQSNELIVLHLLDLFYENYGDIHKLHILMKLDQCELNLVMA